MTVTPCVLVLPTDTFPKLRLVPLAESSPVLDPEVPVFPALVNPTQLESPTVAIIVTKTDRSADGLRPGRLEVEGAEQRLRPVAAGAQISRVVSSESIFMARPV